MSSGAVSELAFLVSQFDWNLDFYVSFIIVSFFFIHVFLHFWGDNQLVGAGYSERKKRKIGTMNAFTVIILGHNVIKISISNCEIKMPIMQKKKKEKKPSVRK